MSRLFLVSPSTDQRAQAARTDPPDAAQRMQAFINDVQVLAIMDKHSLAHIMTRVHRLARHARKRVMPR